MYCIADLETAKIVGHQVLDTGWDVKILKGKGDELVGVEAIAIFQIQPENVEGLFFTLVCLNLLLDHG